MGNHQEIVFCPRAAPNPRQYLFLQARELSSRVTNTSRCKGGSLPPWREISLGLRDWVSWWNHWSYWSSKCGPAVAASHGNLLEMQNSHPKTMESETLRMGYRNLCFNKFSCGFWCLLKFEKHWWKESDITAKDQESEGKELFYHHGPPLKSQSCQPSLHLYICRRSRERHYFLVFSGAENIRKSFGY